MSGGYIGPPLDEILAWIYDPIAPTDAQARAILASLAGEPFHLPPSELKKLTGRMIIGLYYCERDENGRVLMPTSESRGVVSERDWWANHCKRNGIPKWLEQKIWNEKSKK